LLDEKNESRREKRKERGGEEHSIGKKKRQERGGVV
jgi:hypothetical protein